MFTLDKMLVWLPSYKTTIDLVRASNGFKGREDAIIYTIVNAVGILPVTLILVLTISMAAGVKAMVERNVLVRNIRFLKGIRGWGCHLWYQGFFNHEPIPYQRQIRIILRMD